MSDSKRLLIYSDCLVFGGADMLAAYLLGDEELRRAWDVRYVYRDNVAFASGMKGRVPAEIPVASVALPERLAWIECLEAWAPHVLVLLGKALFRLCDPFFFLYDVLRLVVAFREKRPDVVHVNNGGYPGALGCRAAVVAAKLCGARVVLVVHNLARPLTLPGDLFDPLIDRLVGACADAVVSATSLSQKALTARLPREKMRLIEDGVPVPGVKTASAEARRAFGVSGEEPLVVMTAFFEERKGHADLVEAAAALKNSGGLSARFLLIGDGAERDSVERLAAQRGVADRFVFAGYRSDAAEALAAADLMVLPSRHSEDMPLIILDAMALGKPVLSTKLAGIPEEVEDGVTGLLVEPKDAAGLSVALGRLLKDSALRRKMGDAGKKRFSERFEKGRMTAKYRSLYDELASL